MVDGIKGGNDPGILTSFVLFPPRVWHDLHWSTSKSVCVYFLNVKNCWPHLDRIYYIWYSKCFGESLAKVKGKTILLVYFLLILQATAPLASVFIAVQHNATDMETTETPMTYTYGNKDLAAVFFYSLISIVMHAIIQEYVLDVSICL